MSCLPTFCITFLFYWVAYWLRNNQGPNKAVLDQTKTILKPHSRTVLYPALNGRNESPLSLALHFPHIVPSWKLMYWTDRLTFKPLEALLRRPNKFRGTLNLPLARPAGASGDAGEIHCEASGDWVVIPSQIASLRESFLCFDQFGWVLSLGLPSTIVTQLILRRFCSSLWLT